MSDQAKPIKNSLLSGATGSGFFEEAALFVPVPLAEPQEPATAEIDLNSDDSSPNRGSVEKEFADQLTLSEAPKETMEHQATKQEPETISLFARSAEPETISLFSRAEEPQTISLFSRAAATGGDLFSRMMTGSPASKPPPTVAKEELPVLTPPSSNEPVPVFISRPTSRGGVREEAPQSHDPVPAFFQPARGARPEPPLPPFVPPPQTRMNPSPVAPVAPVKGVTDFFAEAAPAPPAVATTKTNNEDTDVPSTISLFQSSAPTTAFVAANVAPPRESPPLYQPAAVAAPVPTSSVFASSIYSGSTPSIFGGPPSNASDLTVSSSVGSIPASTGVAQHGLPPSPVPSIPLHPPMNTGNPAPIIPTYGSSHATLPPPLSGGNPPSNTFRLGGQRMKYVACPEMQSVSPPGAVASPPPNVSFPPMPGTSSVPSLTQTFTPAPPPVSTMGAGLSTHGVYSAIPPEVVDGPPPPPTIMQTAQQQLGQMPMSPPRASAPSNYYPPTPPVNTTYVPQELTPLSYHWFYRKDADGKVVWKPFSMFDSVALEDAFANEPARLVPTDGGRYDVCVEKRVKTSVYWEEAPVDVRRGSWFFKGPMDNRFIPYDEEFAAKLEGEYAHCMRVGMWQKRLEFLDGESVIMHNAGVVVHFCQAAAPDDWGNLPESQIRPRVVKRGVEEIEVVDGESPQIDHLVFVVHGIGPICDFKLRNIVEAVDDFRELSFQLLSVHFRESIDSGKVGRVEFLPVSWHKALHGDKGIDEQLKRITLRSIPKFRDFTNDTLLDILFYTSPVYCQTIIDSVSSELNRLYELFLSRNPSFQGQVSLTGHSLGSLILFDLLAHQPTPGSSTNETDAAKIVDNETDSVAQDVSQTEQVAALSLHATSSKTVSYTVGTAGTGQPFITYPKVNFSLCAFFALGSPIAMFVTVRGIEKLGNDFRFPSCPGFFNIFHPYDPVAYRIETLIDPNFEERPVLIPHHKGRKRIHLELKDTMARVGADVKQKVIDVVKSTMNTVFHYTGFSKSEEKQMENEIQSAIAGEMAKKAEADGAEDENAHIRIGSLNKGRRIDHVLQEAPYETFNEYVFAMSTHVGYWESEDTMLLILTEVYDAMGIARDRVIQGTQHNNTPMGYYGSVSNANYQAPAYDSSSSYQPSAPPMSSQAASLFSMQPNAGASAAADVPMLQSPTVASPSVGVLLPPNPSMQTSTSSTSVASGSRPTIIGNRPVVDPSYFPRGVDPTAPMASLTQVAPPPKVGFMPKQ